MDHWVESDQLPLPPFQMAPEAGCGEEIGKDDLLGLKAEEARRS